MTALTLFPAICYFSPIQYLKAPEGYQLIDELIALEIKNDMEVITVKVTNDSIDIAVPVSYTHLVKYI